MIEVIAVGIIGVIALIMSGTSAYVLYKWVRPIAKEGVPVIRKANEFLANDTAAQIKKIMSNDVPHMMAEQMEKVFIEYAPRMQKAFMVGAEQVARPLMQESMDALGEGISQAVGGVVTEILRHRGAQEFGAQGGIQKVKNAQIKEGKKQLIQQMVAAKVGPVGAGAVATLGLDEMFLDLQEENPELAAMIVQKLNKGQDGGSQPTGRAPARHAKKPGGWYS